LDQREKLVASDGTNSDYFGYSVAISGNYTIVGADNKNNGAGAAYIFEEKSMGILLNLYNDTWTNGSFTKIIGDTPSARKAIWWNYDNSPSGTQIRDNHSIGFYTDGVTGTDHTLRMIIKENGYVGIGTNDPGYILDVRGNLRLGDATTTEQDIHIISKNGNWQFGSNNSGNGTDSNQFYIYDGTYRFTVQKGTGYVGIGTPDPADLFTVGNNYSWNTGGTTSMSILAPGEDADAILYFGTQFTSNNTNAKKAAIIAEGQTTYSRSKLHFCLDNTSNNSSGHYASISKSKMTIHYNGNVGIGTRAPTHPLTIDGSVLHSSMSSGTYWAGDTGVNNDSNGPGNNAMTIKASNGILAMTGFWTKSDERVKKNITEINDYSSLEKVRDISCVSYNYKDEKSRGSSLQIGFIAQQVLKHFPHAINYDTDFIPDKLEKIIDASWNETKLFSESLVDVSGVKYRFYVHDISDNIIETELDIVGNPDNSFTFEKNGIMFFVLERK